MQMVTDNAVSNMVAKSRMTLSRLTLFWSNFASHTISLMLEGIGKLSETK